MYNNDQEYLLSLYKNNKTSELVEILYKRWQKSIIDILYKRFTNLNYSDFEDIRADIYAEIYDAIYNKRSDKNNLGHIYFWVVCSLHKKYKEQDVVFWYKPYIRNNNPLKTLIQEEKKTIYIEYISTLVAKLASSRFDTNDANRLGCSVRFYIRNKPIPKFFYINDISVLTHKSLVRFYVLYAVYKMRRLY